jgi:hypothetical protein
MPSEISLLIAASVVAVARGMPGYAVSGECGAVGPGPPPVPKKS